MQPGYRVRCAILDSVTDLPDALQGGVAQREALLAKDGTVWFATVGGFAQVNPRLRHNPLPPPVAIRSNHRPTAIAAALAVIARNQATLGPRPHVSWARAAIALIRKRPRRVRRIGARSSNEPDRRRSRSFSILGQLPANRSAGIAATLSRNTRPRPGEERP